jgi:hypothetical protein
VTATANSLLHAIVHPADIQDRDGGILVMATLFGTFPFLKKLFATVAIKDPNSTELWRERWLCHVVGELAVP